MAFTRTTRALSATVLTGALVLTAAPAASADQTRRDQWALEALQADSIWKISTGESVTVAVIDTGVNRDHVDLKSNLLEGHDFEDGDDDPTPDADNPNPGHGTGMASIIAGHGHGSGGSDGVKGLAPDAKILPIRSAGTGYAEEIRYAVEHDASIINISEAQSLDSAEDREAVAYALQNDVLIVTGSGNDGDDGIQFPAKYPGVLTVGGVDDSGDRWEGSNYGPEVLLLAPATQIVAAGWPGSNKLNRANGTSNSAAFASAAAALLRSKFPDLTAGQIVNRLTESAALPEAAKGATLPDARYGYGAIQPLAALTEDIPAGGKYGPLKVPESLNASDAGKSEADYEAENKEADRKQMLFLGILALVALAVIVLIAFLIAKMSRRNKNSNGGSGGATGYPPYGQQPVPPQSNSYQQPVSPQQNPYQQPPTPPHNQWPPQQ